MNFVGEEYGDVSPVSLEVLGLAALALLAEAAAVQLLEETATKAHLGLGLGTL